MHGRKNKNMRLHFVLLAAGLSRRYGEVGESKLLEEIDGKPMYEHTLDRLWAIRDRRDDVDDIIVVTKGDEIYRSLRHRNGVICVQNPHSERGISSSLQIGLITAGCMIASKLRQDVRTLRGQGAKPVNGLHCAVFFVADQPYLNERSIEGFLDGYLKSGKRMGCIKSGDQFGNPCAFESGIWPELETLTGDKGGKQIINRHKEDVFFYDISDSRQLQDIDIKETEL